LPDFQNPQQEPGSERRLLLVFLLTFVVLIIFQPLLKKYLPQAPAAPQQKQVPSEQASAPSTVAAPAAAPITPGVTASKQASAEAETVIENDLYKITFTNRGAQVKSWILKKFDNDAQNGPLDLVNAAASQKYGYPLSLWTYEYADPDVVVRKTFRFDHTYVLNVETSVQYKGAEIFAAPAWPSGFGDQITPASYAAARIDYHNDASTDRTALVFPNFISRLAVKSISGGKTIGGPFEWAGPGDQYFTAIFIPDDPSTAALVTLRSSLQVARDPAKPQDKETTNVDVTGAAVGSLHGVTTQRIYVGPKELSSLEAVNVPTIRNGDADLRGTVDFGWWGLIERPLFLWLKWTSELGMGNRHSNFDHHDRAATASHHPDEVDAEDAAHRAADQVDPGKI
jgi:YidC/Oxa1 family membrane protein insertase